MHVGGRRRGKGQRLLYWFRTPPGVRVGRAPIDEAAIRLLEQHNPDVQFDWTRILKDPPVTDMPVRREGRDAREGRDGRERRERERPGPRGRSLSPPAVVPSIEPLASSPVSEADFAESFKRSAIPEFQPAVDVEPGESLESVEATAVETLDAVEPRDQEILAAVDVLAAIEEPFEPTDADRASASFARLGAEGLGRLRARYAEVLARIAERPLEEEARNELKLSAERLNPDAWVTADEVTQALEQYEAVFEGLRAVVGRHPRRRRRSRR
jgi:hypothetical protein